MGQESLFIQEQINILSGKRMMEKRQEIKKSLFTALSFLLKTKQKPTNQPFYISRFGPFSPKSLFRGPFGERFSQVTLDLQLCCQSRADSQQKPPNWLSVSHFYAEPFP